MSQGPLVPFRSLDTVWIQITGTLCNIACRHCFVSAGPKSTSLPSMSRAQVEGALIEAVELGARDAYFTGGEPFLHPEIRNLIDFALERMPLTILTNALLIDDAMAAWIGGRFARSRYSLDVRVSLDGATEETNDRVRGRGVSRPVPSWSNAPTPPWEPRSVKPPARSSSTGPPVTPASSTGCAARRSLGVRVRARLRLIDVVQRVGQRLPDLTVRILHQLLLRRQLPEEDGDSVGAQHPVVAIARLVAPAPAA